MAGKPTKDQIKFQKELNALYKTGAISIKEFTSFQAEMNKMSNSQLRNATRHFKVLEKTTSLEKQRSADKEKALKKEEALQQKINKLQDDQIDIATTLTSNIVKNKKAFEGIGKRSHDVAMNLAKSLKEQVASGKITAKQAKDMAAQAFETARIGKALEAIASNDALASTFQDAQDLASDVAKKIGGLFSSIPGGNALFKALGGEDLEKQLQKGVTAGFSAMAKSMAKGNGLVASLKDGMGAFANVVKGIPNLGIILGIGAVIALAKGLYAVFTNISHAAHDLSEAAGITYTEAKKLGKEARAAQSSFDNQLATFKDITAVQTEMVKGLGSAALVSTKVAASIADTAKAFGVSAETAGAVTNELIKQGNTQEEAAKIQMETNAMALKAGVNVAAVQKDIAANAATAMQYMGGGGEELAAAAVEAAKMGVTLEQMVKTADGLLDIESSLQKQFRAQALTGKSLNFDKARQLALNGDIVGAQKEMLRQAGSLEDFNNMNVVQRKALADAMGMEVGDLQKSLALQKMRGKLTDDEIAAAAGLGKSADELAKMSAEQIQQELAKKNAADKTAAAFDTIKNELLSALAPAAQAFADIFSALTPVIKVLGTALKIAFLPITLAGKALGYLISLADKYKGIVAAIGIGLGANYVVSKGITAESVTQNILAGAAKVKQIALNALKAIGLGTETGITGQKILQKGYDAIAFAKQTIINTLKVAQLGLQTAYNVAMAAGNAVAGSGVGKILAQAGAFLMKAVSGIFASLSQIPFGAGLLLAGGAVAGLFALFNKAKSESAGDVGIAPKGGPIVASPKEGRIFQGTANDGVEMSPTAGRPSSGGGSGTAVIDTAQLNQMITALQGILTAVQSPPPVVIGDNQLAGISSNISARNSFK